MQWSIFLIVLSLALLSIFSANANMINVEGAESSKAKRTAGPRSLTMQFCTS